MVGKPMTGGAMGAAGARHGVRRARAARSRRERGRGHVALGASLLVASMLLADRGAAQVTPAMRLSVRPHEFKGAERTGSAGDIPLDSLPDYSLYVPPACAGAQRCPLLVVAADIPPYAHAMPQTLLGWVRPVADHYGLIMLALEPYPPIRPDSASTQGGQSDDPGLDPRRLDAALAQVFRKVAVDPDRIALLGYLSYVGAPRPKVVQDVGPMAVQNLDVFSRVVLSAAVAADLSLPPTASPQPARFLLAAGVVDDNAPASFSFAGALRHQGYPTELMLSLATSGRGVWEELDYIGQWLRDSWAPPAAGRAAGSADSLVRPSVHTPVRALPLLTTEAIDRLARFWVSFQQEPDSIWRWGRRAHLRTVTLPFGTGAAQPITRLTDMVALAAQYPSVAAKLKAAGLSAAEHDAYRLALINARVVRAFGDSAAAIIAPDSVLAQNAALLMAHQPPQNDDATPGLPGFVPAGHSSYEGDSVLNPEGLRPADSNWLPSGMWQTP